MSKARRAGGLHGAPPPRRYGVITTCVSSVPPPEEALFQGLGPQAARNALERAHLHNLVPSCLEAKQCALTFRMLTKLVRILSHTTLSEKDTRQLCWHTHLREPRSHFLFYRRAGHLQVSYCSGQPWRGPTEGRDPWGEDLGKGGGGKASCPEVSPGVDPAPGFRASHGNNHCKQQQEMASPIIEIKTSREPGTEHLNSSF